MIYPKVSRSCRFGCRTLLRTLLHRDSPFRHKTFAYQVIWCSHYLPDRNQAISFITPEKMLTKIIEEFPGNPRRLYIWSNSRVIAIVPLFERGIASEYNCSMSRRISASNTGVICSTRSYSKLLNSLNTVNRRSSFLFQFSSISGKQHRISYYIC